MDDKPELMKGTAPGTSVIDWDARDFPWWLVGMLLIIGVMGVAVVLNSEYNDAFKAIIPGLGLTLLLTVGSFVASLLFGLLIGLGRITGTSAGTETSPSVIRTIIRNLSTLYIELVRGVPMLVFIFVIAQVIAPDFADLINVESRSIAPAFRASAALSLFYAAFIAEVFPRRDSICPAWSDRSG